MIRRKSKFLKQLLITVECLVICLSYFSAFFLRGYISRAYHFDLFPSHEIIARGFEFTAILSFFWLVFPVWIFCLYYNGLYNEIKTKTKWDVVWSILKANVYGAFIVTAFMYIFKTEDISRLFVALYIIIVSAFVFVERLVLSFYFNYKRKNGVADVNVLLIGTGSRAESFMKLIKEHNEWGLNIIAVMDYEEEKCGIEFFGKTIFDINNLEKFLHDNIIDEVVFVIPRDKIASMEKYILQCEIEGIKVSLAIDLFNLDFAKSHVSNFHGLPLLTFESTPFEEWRLFVKRFFDIISSFIGIIILSPFLFMVSVLIKLTSPGSVFFSQDRVGLKGRIFKMLKFRTMCEDAESKKQELEKHNEMDGPVFKIEKDPRITFLGKILRKTSIDELPQLFNILKGDMSVVGPRPPVPEEVKQYEVWQRRRLSMRPGLTCIWQISGRNEISDFEKWMNLDLQYIDNWSLKLDFLIILKTVPVVLFCKGAK